MTGMGAAVTVAASEAAVASNPADLPQVDAAAVADEDAVADAPAEDADADATEA